MKIETLKKIDNDGEEGDCYSQVSGKYRNNDDFGYALNQGYNSLAKCMPRTRGKNELTRAIVNHVTG